MDVFDELANEAEVELNDTFAQDEVITKLELIELFDQLLVI